MADDIRGLLDEWPYDPEEDLTVRQIPGPGGEARLQLRLELGLLEMHAQGRPDGLRPAGFPSLLELHQAQLSRVDDEDEYQLDHEQCQALQQESLQYYHRRIGYLKLGDYLAAVADADHNLAIMDLLRDRAADRNDWLASEQYRSFVLTHRTRAQMLAALDQQDLAAALAAVEQGIARLEQLYREDYQRPELLQTSDDLAGLRQVRQSLIQSDRVVIEGGDNRELQLDRELAAAIAAEDFEDAARLRDELEQIRQAKRRRQAQKGIV
ncbi:MAG: UvrB/UvrC motif-containing protein [Fimbriimonadaceae bacterium]|nr:UvrB/UvrC motif-containing protein [Fimbriimonadaceae bacterium]